MSQMLKEIQEQPAAIERTLLEGLADAEKLRKRFAENPPRAVVLIARGTSDNAATFGRYLIEITTGLPVSLAAPSVTTLYGSKLKLDGALVVGVSQSGESTDVNACMEAARESGAFTIGITNEASSALAAISEAALLVRAGREKSVAATKTYTGQLIAFYLLAYALGGGVQIDRLKELPETVESCLGLASGVRELANRYRFMERVVVIGRGLNYANAFEFALKLMETCYVTAERFSGADFAHGPIALLERDYPAFLFAPPGPTAQDSLAMLQRLVKLEAETLVLAPQSATETLELARRAIRMPAVPGQESAAPQDLYTPAPYIVPAQMFAAFLAEEKGLNPDQPRTLSKVTRTL
ncbi:MAG: SIS domain-containing protein [Acidobacteria bacterium]|nr:SIS domain-containing protein [Acidobacteriota bacterium]